MPPTPPITVHVPPRERPRIAHGRTLGVALQKALGMDGRRITRIVLDVPANGAVRVTVTEFVTEDEAGAITEAVFDSPIMQRFRAREQTTSVEIEDPA